MRVSVYLAMAISTAGLAAGCSKDGEVAGPQAEAPKVVTMSPAPGQDYVAADQEFAAEFSHPMDRASVEGAYHVSGGQGAMAGHFRWSDDGSAMAFVPAAAMVPGQEVRVRWGQGMHTRSGDTLMDGGGTLLGAFEFACTVYGPRASFQTNGERIYFTATSASGDPITYRMGHGFDDAAMPGYGAMGSGLVGMMSGGMMGGGMGGLQAGTSGGVRGMACVSCHGPDGAGGKYLAMGTVRTPSIQAAALAAVDEAGADGHAPYDDGTLARAIADGLDPKGADLNGFMPRWSMAAQDMAELVTFIKTL